MTNLPDPAHTGIWLSVPQAQRAKVLAGLGSRQARDMTGSMAIAATTVEPLDMNMEHVNGHCNQTLAVLLLMTTLAGYHSV